MLIYKLCARALWEEAQPAGFFTGAPVDRRDGYIHFSTSEQLEETARKHFAGQADLMLLTIDATQLGDALTFEPSRGGALFPHLYGTLPLFAVIRAEPYEVPA